MTSSAQRISPGRAGVETRLFAFLLATRLMTGDKTEGNTFLLSTNRPGSCDCPTSTLMLCAHGHSDTQHGVRPTVELRS